MKRLSVLLITLSMLLLASSHGWGQITGKSLILQDSSAPAKTITLRPPGALQSSYSLIYPSALPAGNGYLLTGTTAGLLRWSPPDSVIGSLAWLLNGNTTITVPTADAIAAGENFVGTRGAQELVLGTNATRRVRIDGTSGNVGIAAAPSAAERLNVHGMINTDSAYNIAGTNWLWAGPQLGGGSNVLVGNTGNTTLASDDNTFVGARAGESATTGIDNTFIGSTTGAATTTGSDNTYIGAFTGQMNAGGSANTVVGSSATNVMTNGDHNTVMGFASGNGLKTGSNNTFIGSSVATSLNTANGATVLGAQASANTGVNVTVLGARAYATANNSLVLGSINGVNGATADVNVGIGTTAPSQKLEVRNGNLLLSNSGTAGELRMGEPNGTDYTAFKAQSQSGTITYTLPPALPAANNYLLSSTTAGLLSWADPASVVGSSAWLLTGNNITAGGTGPGQQFIGTTTGNKQPFVVATDGAERARVDSVGRVMMGTATPAAEVLTVIDTIAPTAIADKFATHSRLFFSPTVPWVGTSSANGLRADVILRNSQLVNSERVAGIIGAGAMDETATAPATQLRAIRANLLQRSTTQTIGHGISAEGIIESQGVITHATSFLARMANGPGSATGTYRGLYVTLPLGGTIDSTIGIDILPLTSATTNLAFRYAHATRPVIIDGAGRMMIGTTTPVGDRLTVIDSINPSTVSDRFTIKSSLTLSPTAAQIGTQAANGLHSDVIVKSSVAISSERLAGIIGTGAMDPASTAPLDQLRGIKGNILQRNTTQTVTNAIAVEGSVSNDGVLTDATSVLASMRNAVTATTRAYRGVYVTSPNAGTIDSLIGIDIQQLAQGTLNLAFRYAHPTSPVVITGTGNVGIGLNNPAAKLHVTEAFTPAVSADRAMTYMLGALTPTIPYNNEFSTLTAVTAVGNTSPMASPNIWGGSIGVIHNPGSASASRLIGLRAYARTDNIGQTLTDAFSVNGYVESRAPITDGTSFQASSLTLTGGTVANYRGVRVENPGKSGTGVVTNVYGVDIDHLTAGSTSNTAFRYNHPTSPVVITGTGNMGVGTASPAQKAEVRDGNVLLSNSGTAGELRMQEPNASGANYSAFKAQAQASDITYTLPPSLPVANNYVLASTTGGGLTWENPATLTSGSFVQYNVPTPQGTAAASNRLFDVRYGGLGAGADALGARILSTSGTNANATGLTLTSTANGTGTSTALSVSATGGTNNYAALFNGGNVGINVLNPNSRLTVAEAIGTANRDTSMVGMFYSYNPTANPAPNVTVAAQLIRLTMNNTAAQTSGLISAVDFGAALGSTATAGTALITGIRGFAANGNTTQTVTQAVGVSGHIQNNGPMTNGISFLANSQVLAGTMTNYIGLRVQNPGLSGGTIQNAYGIRIDTMTAGSVSNTAFHYNHPTFPVVITGAGKVGVGTTAPISYHQIDGPAYTATTTVPGDWTPFLASRISQTLNPAGAVGANFHSLMAYDSLAITGTSNMATGVAISRLSRVRNFNTSTIGEIRGIQTNIHNENAGTVTLANGVYADVSNNTTGNVTQANAYSSLLQNTGAGTMTTATGFRSRPHVGGTGNITTFNAVWADLASHIGTGRVINYNGVVVSSIDPAEVTGTRNAFLYDGIGANDAVAITGAGRVGIGTTTPTASLDVNGGVVLREDASVNNVNADNFPVTVGNRSYMRIGCNQAGAATTKTITLSAGLRVGQVLVIEATGNNSFEIADNAGVNNTNTPLSRTMAPGTVETMIWNGTSWIEISYAAN